MTLNINPQCMDCTRLKRSPAPWHCTAFEKGIPSQIYGNSHDHNEPFPGDNGILFDPKEDTS